MSEKDMIIVMFIFMFFYAPYSAWQIASIRDELRQVMKQLKEQSNDSSKVD